MRSGKPGLLSAMYLLTPWSASSWSLRPYRCRKGSAERPVMRKLIINSRFQAGWRACVATPCAAQPAARLAYRRSDYVVRRRVGGSEDRAHCGDRALDVSRARPPIDNAYPHGSSPAPGRTREECLAGRIDPLNDFVREGVVLLGRLATLPKANQPLVQVCGGHNLGARQCGDAPDERIAVRTAAIHHRFDPLPPQLLECGVDGDASSAAGPLGVPVNLVARALFGSNVGGAERYRSAMRIAIANDGDAAVKWDVEPLVSVCGPAIRLLDSFELSTMSTTSTRKEAEGTIDMYPCVGLLRHGDQLSEGIASADVQIGGVQNHDDRTCRVGERSLERLRRNMARVVGLQRHECGASEPKISDGSFDRAVLLVVGHDGDSRRTEHADVFDVPVRAL